MSADFFFLIVGHGFESSVMNSRMTCFDAANRCQHIHLGGVATLEELYEQHLHPASGGTDGKSDGSGGFSFSISAVKMNHTPSSRIR